MVTFYFCLRATLSPELPISCRSHVLTLTRGPVSLKSMANTSRAVKKGSRGHRFQLRWETTLETMTRWISNRLASHGRYLQYRDCTAELGLKLICVARSDGSCLTAPEINRPSGVLWAGLRDEIYWRQMMIAPPTRKTEHRHRTLEWLVEPNTVSIRGISFFRNCVTCAVGCPKKYFSPLQAHQLTCCSPQTNSKHAKFYRDFLRSGPLPRPPKVGEPPPIGSKKSKWPQRALLWFIPKVL